ncbi:hypothetical protein BJ508DRAFT_327580 [Ascobolus immersus RN42]|uniref:Uncharacterized protein n=1 Tax=Ascobolus immersus RN42 TaxID=1160509 RepID=A0A3N4I7W5_ASCIM|nr:hypothetical protein BJ508DRAFT_327580 [Ascobolus immersus RN42]
MVQPAYENLRHRQCVAGNNNNLHKHNPRPNCMWDELLRNMNINIGKMAYNRYHYIPSDPDQPWVVPYRLRDNETCSKFDVDGEIFPKPYPNPLPAGVCGAPKTRRQAEDFTKAQWFALSAFYEFDWEDRELDIGECRAHWAVWCGCNGVTDDMVLAEDSDSDPDSD